MTRIGTFVQMEPKVDKDAELFCMGDNEGGIYIAVTKKARKQFFEKPDVMLRLSRKQVAQLDMLLHNAFNRKRSEENEE